MVRRRYWKNILIHLFLCVVGFFTIFPILWMVSLSLRERGIVMQIPPEFIFKPTIESYFLVVSGQAKLQFHFLDHLRNSLSVATASTILSLLIGTLAAYALVRVKMRGRKLISFSVILTRMLPPIAMIVPIFLLMMKLNVLDSLLGLTLAYTALFTPIVIWMLMGFLSRLPYEIEEAALIDGCTQFGVLRRIVLPLIAPALAAVGFYSFVGAWNDFTMAVVLTSRKAATLPMMIITFATAIHEPLSWGPICAAGSLVIIPPILFTLFFSKYLVSGLAAGGVKG